MTQIGCPNCGSYYTEGGMTSVQRCRDCNFKFGVHRPGLKRRIWGWILLIFFGLFAGFGLFANPMEGYTAAQNAQYLLGMHVVGWGLATVAVFGLVLLISGYVAKASG